MDSSGNLVAVYAAYVVVAVVLTAWLARTLFQSGAAFLHDVFDGKAQLSQAVNRLLVVGFYMLNLGYALYILRASRGLVGFDAVQFLVNRLAVLLVSLAGIHFVNMLVFWWIRTRHERRHLPTPVVPQALVPPTPAMPEE